MIKLSPLLVALAALIGALVSAPSSAQLAFSTHASSCEAVRPANGHFLVHKREGLENPSTRTTWISCPVIVEAVFFPADYFFSALVYNVGDKPVKVTCILRYLDLDSGFRNISRTITVPYLGAEILEWDLASRDIVSPNVNCKLPPGGSIASILSLATLGAF